MCSNLQQQQQLTTGAKSSSTTAIDNKGSSNLLNNTSSSNPVKDPSNRFEPLTFAQELTRCELEHLCFLGKETYVDHPNEITLLQTRSYFNILIMSKLVICKP